MAGETNLIDLLGIWDINFNRVRRELGVKQESGVQMDADKIRVDIPLREDLI